MKRRKISKKFLASRKLQNDFLGASKKHPRHLMLSIQETLVDGTKKGITTIHGLMAHGRGEAFDYMLGEKTNNFAKKSIEAAACLLLLAKHPVISVNGNTAALVPKELVNLSRLLNAPLEVNIFHTSRTREVKIKNYLTKHGSKKVLMPSNKYKLKFISSNRKYVNPDGIFKADVVFVPLEDGDRAEALIKNRKKVIAVDLNPMSRTSKKATITIVDNIIRAMTILNKTIKHYKKYNKNRLNKIIKNYDNKEILKNAIKAIK